MAFSFRNSSSLSDATGATDAADKTNKTVAIKFCGLTRETDVQAAVACGADALGFVFYEKSPRYVSPEKARQLLVHVPASVVSVGLFVNATIQEIQAVLAIAPIGLLQFHGDETFEQCVAIAQAVNKPFLRAVRVSEHTLPEYLLQCQKQYATNSYFQGLLLDTFHEPDANNVQHYGGTGKVFNWSLIPKELAPLVVLSGGLNIQNVTEAVTSLRPFAVDVSSGIEAVDHQGHQQKGIKNHQAMQVFAQKAKNAIAQ